MIMGEYGEDFSSRDAEASELLENRLMRVAERLRYQKTVDMAEEWRRRIWHTLKDEATGFIDIAGQTVADRLARDAQARIGEGEHEREAVQGAINDMYLSRVHGVVFDRAIEILTTCWDYRDVLAFVDLPGKTAPTSISHLLRHAPRERDE